MTMLDTCTICGTEDDDLRECAGCGIEVCDDCGEGDHRCGEFRCAYCCETGPDGGDA